MTNAFAQFPFGGGIDELTDPRLVEPPAVTSATNVRIPRPGSYGKRWGTSLHRTSAILPSWGSDMTKAAASAQALFSFDGRLVYTDAVNVWADSPARSGFEWRATAPFGMPRKMPIWADIAQTTAVSAYVPVFGQPDVAIGLSSGGAEMIAIAWTSQLTRVNVIVMDTATRTPVQTTFSTYTNNPVYTTSGFAPRLAWLGTDLYLVIGSGNNLSLRKLTTSTWTWSTVGNIVTDCRSDTTNGLAWYDVSSNLTSSTQFALAYQTTGNALKVLKVSTGAAVVSTVTSSEAAAAVDAIGIHATTNESVWVTYIRNASQQTRVTNIVESTWLERASFPRNGPSTQLGNDNICSAVVRINSTTALLVYCCTTHNGASWNRGPFTQAATCTTGATLSSWRGNAPYSMLACKPIIQGGRYLIPATCGGQFQSTKTPIDNVGAQWTFRVMEALRNPPTDGGSFSSQNDWGMAPNVTVIPNVASSAPLQNMGNAGDTYFAPCSTVTRDTVTYYHVWPEIVGYANGQIRATLNLISYDTSATAHLAGKALAGCGYYAGNVIDSSFGIEHGFTERPESLDAVDAGAGNVDVGTFYYRACWAWANKAGQVMRSAPGNAVAHTVAGVAQHVTVTIPLPSCSAAYWPAIWDAARPWVELYRSKLGAAGPYYYVGRAPMVQPDDTSTACYVTIDDNTSDATAQTYPQLYTGDTDITLGGRAVVANAGAPTFVCTAVHKGRVFGVWPDRRTVSFSSGFVAYEMPHVHNEFTLTIDDDIVALASLDDGLYAFSATRIYVLYGDGPSDRYPGADSDYRGFQRIASDVGCSDALSICTTADGVVFRSTNGLNVLSRGGQVSPFGREVQDSLTSYATRTWITLHPSRRWLYVTCDNGTNCIRLVYDYANKVWTKDTVAITIASDRMFSPVAYSGSVYFASPANGSVYKEDTTTYADLGVFVAMSAVLAPFKSGGAQGFQGTTSLYMLANRESAHGLSITVDYNHGTAKTETFSWSEAEVTAFGTSPVEQFRRSLVVKENAAARVTITDTAPATLGTGQGATWISWGIEHQPKPVPTHVPAGQQR